MKLLEREPYLQQLEGMLTESRRGHGRLVLVTGDAGIGKTSLVEAFCSTIHAGVRVLWGSCDAIVPPRPFAPIVDIAAAAGGPLRAALEAADRDRIYDEFLTLVRRGSRQPSIVVLEDLHWADDATLDLLRVVGRRLRDVAVLIIGTYRDDEVGPDHPLRLALGDVPTGTLAEVALPPLSAAAVGSLAAGTGIDADALHRIAGGNPFFVTEVMAGGGTAVPTTVRDAVLARASRLSGGAQALLHAASVLGPRFDPVLAGALAGTGHADFEECVGRGLLEVDGAGARFRHELAQRAIEAGLTAHTRAGLHLKALRELERKDRARNVGTGEGLPSVDPGEVARHAAAAGAEEALLRWAPLAARRAAELGAHREAAAHYGACLPFATRLDERARAELLEAHATQARLTDDVDAAVTSLRTALGCWRGLGDRRREAECLRELSLVLWFAGEGDQAREVAQEAVSILEGLAPRGPALAMAYAVLAQRIFNRGEDDDLARYWAQKAIDLADQVDDERVRVHAQTTIGAIDAAAGHPEGFAMLEASARRAEAIGAAESVSRAFINLVEVALERREFELADGYVEQAMASLADRDFDTLARYLRSRLAQLALERGRWHEAEDLARALLEHPSTTKTVRARALTIMGRLHTRRGDGDQWQILDDALESVEPNELQDVLPLRAARAEAAVLDGDHDRAKHEAEVGLRLALSNPQALESPWWFGELAFLAWQSGARTELPEATPKPYRLQAAGQPRAAAAAWAVVGCPYERALALAASTEPSDLREALETFVALGAKPMSKEIAARLRAMGATSIPRGPRPTTRRNPARLTAREMEVLDLIRDGLRNADIADRLVLSPKTVDHHVSAILRKLGVADRHAAAASIGPAGGAKDGEIATAR